MNSSARKTLHLVLDAAARLLVLLSVAFLVYQIRLRTSEPEYHPLYLYWRYVVGLVSFRPGETTQGIATAFFIKPAIPRSIALFAVSMGGAFAGGYALARWNFVRFRERAVRRLERIGSVGYALPIAVLAMLLFILASETGWFPIGGTTGADFGSLSPVGKFVDIVHHFALPWATLTLFPALVLLRAGMASVEELRSAEYVLVARSHGLRERELFTHHVRRPLIARLLGDLAAHLPLFVTYLVVVELVFRYSGVGYYMVMPYSGFWGGRGEDSFIISQAALVYVGGITIVVRLVLRLLGLWLMPSLRGADDRRGAGLLPVFALLAVVATLGGLAAPWMANSGSGIGWLIGAAAIGVFGVGYVVVLAVRRRPSRGAQPKSRESILSPSETNEVGHGGKRRVLARGQVDGLTTGRSIAVGVLVVLIVAPWIMGPPDRPSTFILLRPNAWENPILIWYYFLRTLVIGRFLLVVLIAAIGGAAIGSTLGTLVGYYRVPGIDRGVSYVEVFPSIVVAIVVAGMTEVPGAPLFAALLLAASIRFYAESRDFAYELSRRDFARYSAAIGEGNLEQFYRHVLPNLARRAGSTLLALYVDLIVLTVNLSFLRLVAYRAAREPVEGPLRYLAMLTYEWGSALAGGRSDFIKGIYIPSVWPIVFLVATILLLRYVGRGGGRR